MGTLKSTKGGEHNRAAQSGVPETKETRGYGDVPLAGNLHTIGSIPVRVATEAASGGVRVELVKHSLILGSEGSLSIYNM